MTATVREILSEVYRLDGTHGTLPQRLCSLCAKALDITGVSMTLHGSNGGGEVVAATDPVARALADLQFELSEGPGVDAGRDGRRVFEPNLGAGSAVRWSGFRPSAIEQGAAAVFAFPLHVGAIALGVLELHRTSSGGLTDDDLATAGVYVDAAYVIVASLQAQVPPEQQRLHPELTDVLDTRSEVHQATGMIAVQAGVPLADALSLLRARAYATERSIVDLARDVVARRLRFDSDLEQNGE